MKELRKEIIDNAHVYSITDKCRQYYKAKGITKKNINRASLNKLKQFIRKEIYTLSLDKSYELIDDMDINKVIVKTKFGASKLTVEASYFSNREGVTFQKDGFVGFCGWASGCNRIPFIVGFINWCDYMTK